MIYKPRVPQLLIRNYGLDHKRCNIFATPGTGKSAATLELIDLVTQLDDIKRVLVLGPLRVARDVWPSEATQWENFQHLDVQAAIGTPAQRLKIVRSNPQVLCLNYEMIEWLVDGYGDEWPFDMVIADESTRLKSLRITLTKNDNVKGQGGARAKKAATIAKHARRWVNLTGSPAPNGLQDLWGQNWFVDAGRRLGPSFTDFKRRWFYTKNNSDGYPMLIPTQAAQPEIQELMRSCSISIRAKDYYPISEPIENVVLVDLPPQAYAQYKQMQKELFTLIRENPVEAFTNGTKMNKCLQIANGTVFFAEDQSVEVHNAKLEALRSMVEEYNGEPIIVRYMFTPDRDRILKAFPRARRLRTKADEDAWNRGEIPMLVVHPASMGHGLSLQHGGRVLIDYSTSFDLEHDEQVIERIGPTRQFQSGYQREVFRTRLIAKGTIEQSVALPRIRSKMSVQEAFKLAMIAQ